MDNKKTANGTKYVTTTFVKRKIGQLIDGALAGERFCVCRNGRPVAIVSQPSEAERQEVHEQETLLS